VLPAIALCLSRGSLRASCSTWFGVLDGFPATSEPLACALSRATLLCRTAVLRFWLLLAMPLPKAAVPRTSTASTDSAIPTSAACTPGTWPSCSKIYRSPTYEGGNRLGWHAEPERRDMLDDADGSDERDIFTSTTGLPSCPTGPSGGKACAVQVSKVPKSITSVVLNSYWLRLAIKWRGARFLLV